MKTLNYVKILLLCVFTIGLASCGDDVYYTMQNSDDKLCGKTWIEEYQTENKDGVEVLCSHQLKFAKADNSGQEIWEYYRGGEKYTKMLLLFVLVLGLTSCDSEEETEYNLPGEWYTSEEIDFGAYTWGRGTIMTFNARNQGTIGSYGDPNYLLFRWNWVSSVVLGIIAGGNIKIIFTDSLFVCVGNDDMLINKKRSKSIAPFFIVCQLFTYSSKPIS